MPSLRGITQVVITTVSLGLVVGGLVLSGAPGSERVVLERPGAAARLATASTTATAFFEIDGDMVELTMLFSEPDEPTGVFRTRVRLIDGQIHTVVIGEPDDPDGPHRYTFRRVGYTVEMVLTPVQTLNASLIVQ